jgi:glucose-6-phosphate 1-dehydrogenase
MDDALAKSNTVIGQYAEGAVGGKPVVGYCQEDEAEPESNTETFVAIKAEIENWRWAGVPFYLRTGKRLPRRVSEIVVEFKQVPHSIFGTSAAISTPNRLLLRLQPDEIIRLELMNKVPGLDAGMPLKKVSLDLSVPVGSKTHTPGAYERLLLDVLRANATLFVRAAEVEQAWVWVDQIHEAWARIGKQPGTYTAGTWGPSESVALVARDGRSWYEGK